MSVYQINSGYQPIEKKSIEFICTANCGRSVPSELIAQQYLEQTGRSSYYQAISSGTGVDMIRQGKQSLGFKAGVINIAISRGLYASLTGSVKQLMSLSADQLKSLYETDSAVKAAVDAYFDQAVEVFKAEEHKDRYEATKDLGLESRIKQDPEQTVARDDTIAVLTMDKRTLEGARKAYEGSGFDPTISLLKEYATGEQGAEVMNAFGLGPEVYKRTIEELRRLVPMAVDRAIEEHESKSQHASKQDSSDARESEESAESEE